MVDISSNYLIPAPGHDFCVTTGHGDCALVPTVFIDRMASVVCQQSAPPLAAGEVVRVENCGAYAGVMREEFVDPLPTVHFAGIDPTVVLGRPGPDDVAHAHGWEVAP